MTLSEYFFVEPKYDNIEVRKKMWSNRNNDLLEAAKKVIVQEKDVFENSKTLKKRMKQLLKETEGKNEDTITKNVKTQAQASFVSKLYSHFTLLL